MTVTTDKRGHVLVVTINRPEARNAINGDVTKAMSAALDEAEADRDVWVVVLTGAGDKAFSAGMDLKVVASGAGVGEVVHPTDGFAGIVRRKFGKPIVAAVNGHALAGGLEIMLSCDVVVAAEEATIGIPEVKRGLLAAAGGPFRLSERIPLAIALELGMTGAAITAERAREIGLVNRVVPRARVLDEAIALAEQICENSPAAVRATRTLMHEAADLDEDAAWKRSDELMGGVLRAGDAVEGATAFVEKRAPVWKSG